MRHLRLEVFNNSRLIILIMLVVIKVFNALAVGAWVALMVYVYNEVYRFSERRLLLPLVAGCLGATVAALARLLSG
ncbi:MAG: hypothetical protein QXP31_04370 [Pyrobaculum sp.]